MTTLLYYLTSFISNTISTISNTISTISNTDTDNSNKLILNIIENNNDIDILSNISQNKCINVIALITAIYFKRSDDIILNLIENTIIENNEILELAIEYKRSDRILLSLFYNQTAYEIIKHNPLSMGIMELRSSNIILNLINTTSVNYIKFNELSPLHLAILQKRSDIIINKIISISTIVYDNLFEIISIAIDKGRSKTILNKLIQLDYNILTENEKDQIINKINYNYLNCTKCNILDSIDKAIETKADDDTIYKLIDNKSIVNNETILLAISYNRSETLLSKLIDFNTEPFLNIIMELIYGRYGDDIIQKIAIVKYTNTLTIYNNNTLTVSIINDRSEELVNSLININTNIQVNDDNENALSLAIKHRYSDSILYKVINDTNIENIPKNQNAVLQIILTANRCDDILDKIINNNTISSLLRYDSITIKQMRRIFFNKNFVNIIYNKHKSNNIYISNRNYSYLYGIYGKVIDNAFIINSKDNKECFICLGDFEINDNKFTLNCGHNIHSLCKIDSNNAHIKCYCGYK